MSLYFAYIDSLRNRSCDAFFCFDKDSCLLRSSHQDYLFKFESSLDYLDRYKKMVKYAYSHHIYSFEMNLIEKIDIKELIVFLSDYLKDKDISIGLLTFDQSLIQNNKVLLDSYGVTYSKPLTKRIFDSKSLDIDSIGSTNGLKMMRSKKATIELEESFHERFIKLLIESGKDNVEIYKKAGISRQVFSKILSDKNMIPSKLTLISLCIGLELTLKDANELMVSAGYSLSKSILLDAIVMKYISESIYDFDLINSELNEYGCQLLGWHPRDN